MKFWSILLCALLSSPIAISEPYTPSTVDQVIASWPRELSGKVNLQTDPGKTNSKQSLAKAEQLLQQADLPGQSHYYQKAKVVLEPLIQSGDANTQALQYWARILQHQHQFEQALRHLDTLLQREPGNVMARLMAARLLLVSNQPKAAQQHCLALLGNADLYTGSVCALEAASYTDAQSLAQSYQQLSRIVAREPLPEDKRGAWVEQVLADMAFRLGEYSQASAWLNADLEQASVSYLSQWADIQLALRQPSQVLATLGPIVNRIDSPEDALLLRLAIAEQAVSGTRWQDRMQERVGLRTQRRDTLHASDIARYYLDVDPNPGQALRWATINWQQAREPADAALLERARKQVAQHQASNTLEPGEQE